jgi:16S rRNA (guanine527-N7)-methyltransferase
MAVPEVSSQEVRARIDALVELYRLPDGASDRLAALVELFSKDPHAPTAIRDPIRVVDEHLADSLVALDLDQLRAASEVVDLGSGAGLPGLALAIALPRKRFALVESASRKAAFIQRAVALAAVENVEVVHARAEAWPDGLDRFDVATARALAPLDVVAEYAAPLLRLGGSLVAWRGRRDPGEEAAADRAAATLGLRVAETRSVQPHSGAINKHLTLMLKEIETPRGFPRRPGVARKRPLGGPRARTSDRGRR